MRSWNPQKQTGSSLIASTKKTTQPTTRKSAVSFISCKKSDFIVTVKNQIPHPRYSGTHSSNRSFLTKKPSFGGTATMEAVNHKKMETTLNHINLPVRG